MWQRLVTSIVFLALAIRPALAGPGTPGNDASNPPHARIAQLYKQACAGCHGETGDGTGPSTRHLTPRPRPPFTDKALIAGREIYDREGCADCHGARGLGDGPKSAQLRDAANQATRPRDLTNRTTYKGGSRPEDIYRTLATGLDGSPMVALRKWVTDLERWQLAWYVHSLIR